MCAVGDGVAHHPPPFIATSGPSSLMWRGGRGQHRYNMSEHTWFVILDIIILMLLIGGVGLFISVWVAKDPDLEDARKYGRRKTDRKRRL